jgi:hypothetical protein
VVFLRYCFGEGKDNPRWILQLVTSRFILNRLGPALVHPGRYLSWFSSFLPARGVTVISNMPLTVIFPFDSTQPEQEGNSGGKWTTFVRLSTRLGSVILPWFYCCCHYMHWIHQTFKFTLPSTLSLTQEPRALGGFVQCGFYHTRLRIIKYMGETKFSNAKELNYKWISAGDCSLNRQESWHKLPKPIGSPLSVSVTLW